LKFEVVDVEVEVLKSQSFSSLLDDEDMMNLHGWVDSVLMAGVQT